MPAPSRYADTKVDANGRRVPASQFEEAESAARSTKVDPGTQIAADGTRKPADEIDPNEAAPVGRTAEARMRDERAAHIDAAPKQVAPTDDHAETVSHEDAPADAEPDDADADVEVEVDTEDDLESKTKAELLEIAREKDIEGRSEMNKDEFLAAVKDA